MRSERTAAAQKQLVDLLGHTKAQIGAVGAYIDSRRGAVGPDARTRLSEATQASQLVDSAQTLAQQDVADFEAQQRGAPADLRWVRWAAPEAWLSAES